jgi:serine/threonine protein kinase/formylglycine-generating enzyme required for sulfatase activity
MANAEAVHAPAERLAVYAQGRLDDPEMAEIEEHLSWCDSCCRTIRDQPDDSFVARLRSRSTAMLTSSVVTENEPAEDSLAGFQVPSSLIFGPTENTALHDQSTVAGPSVEVAKLPRELKDHPRYKVVAMIGAGGMGAVYRAEHRLMDRPVALKLIRGDLLGNAALVERFRREVKLAARLASHPNIVAAYDAEQAGETHMLVMEFIEGTDLAREVDRRGPLPVGEACDYARQAALGLQHAFEEGMVHRDIKPQNLMRTTRGRIKILDFGLARFASELASQGGLTAEGMVLGSADYIAPEQIHDPHSADIRADIYSLGCTLYFLLVGRPPFPGGGLIQKLHAHSEKTPRQLADLRPEVPAELAGIVERMMAKDPSLRPSTPAEVVRALAPLADSLERSGQVLNPPEVGSAPAAAKKPNERLLSDSALDPGPRRSRSNVADRQGRFGARVWWAAVGLLLLALVIACGIVLRVKTANGMIELVNLPKDAEVLVDGQEVAVTWPGGGTPAIVTVTAGKHRIAVKKDGIEITGDEVTVRANGKEKFTVRFVAPAKPAHEVPKVYELESMKNSIGMTLRLIPAGEFFMGSADEAIEAENEEKPLHRLRITKPFFLGVCEVTQAEYQAVMGDNPSWFSANGERKDQVAGQSTQQFPVENVSWLDAIQFCNKLSERENKKSFYEIDSPDVRVPDWDGQGYRLPTEAEWEHACRANAPTPTRFSFGDNPVELGYMGGSRVTRIRERTR